MSAGHLSVDMALVQAFDETWVVLRESYSDTRRERAVLTQYFEYFASSLRIELVHLKRMQEPLRFFHLTYEAGPGPHKPVQWVFKEVHLQMSAGMYTLARWERAAPDLQELLSGELRLSAPQKRTCL